MATSTDSVLCQSTTSLTSLFVSSLIYPSVLNITNPEKKDVQQLMAVVTSASLKYYVFHKLLKTIGSPITITMEIVVAT